MKNLDQDTDPNSDLKVLSSEMDPAESRLIRQVFTKERGTEVFIKIRLFPILREPFTVTASSHIVTVTNREWTCLFTSKLLRCCV
jgi:hypothetical protein